MFCAAENKPGITLMTMVIRGHSVWMTLGSHDWSPHCPDAWDRLSLAHLWSWWWRKLNHLLIEDDKEPTHLCYPQWSRCHTMTTRQSLNNPPNIQLSPATDNEISTHTVSISDKKEKLSQENDLPEWKAFTTGIVYSLAESLFSLSVRFDNCLYQLIICSLLSVRASVIVFIGVMMLWEG